MTRIALLLALSAVPSCADETISGYAGDVVWQLAELDGAVVSYEATLTFPEVGQIVGRAPCNTFAAPQTAPYPWLEIGRMAVTRAFCAQMEGERAYLTALRSMTVAEVSGDVLILSNDAGREMLFRSQE